MKSLFRTFSKAIELHKTLGGRKGLLSGYFFGAHCLVIHIQTKLGLRLSHNLSLCYQNVPFRFSVRQREDLVVLYEVFIKKEYLCEVKNPKNVLDLGSNIGASLIYFAINYPTASILGVEGNPEITKQLKKNTKSFANVTIIEGLVSDIDGSVELFIGTNPLSSSVKRRSKLTNSTIVKSLTPKSLQAQMGGVVFDLVKFDIEGAEGDVYKNGAAFGKKHIGEVHLDLLEQDKETFLSFFKDFKVETANIDKNRFILFAQ